MLTVSPRLPLQSTWYARTTRKTHFCWQTSAGKDCISFDVFWICYNQLVQTEHWCQNLCPSLTDSVLIRRYLFPGIIVVVRHRQQRWCCRSALQNILYACYVAWWNGILRNASHCLQFAFILLQTLEKFIFVCVVSDFSHEVIHVSIIPTLPPLLYPSHSSHFNMHAARRQ